MVARVGAQLAAQRRKLPKPFPCKDGGTPVQSPTPCRRRPREAQRADSLEKPTQQDADDRGRPGENGAEKPTHSWSRIPGVVATPYMHAWTDKIDHALCRRYFCWERCSGESFSPQQELYLLVSEINWYSFDATWAVFARVRSGKKRRRTTEKIHEDTHFFVPPLPPQTVLPPRPTQNHVRKQTKWKNVFPCKASLTTNVPTSLVGKKSKSKWERGTALPLSKSAMRPTRNISIMHTMITIMRLAIVFFRFASGATQQIAVRNFYVVLR